MLQARGRERARDRLMGILKGTLPVAIWQRQPVPLVVNDFSTLQQSEVGAVPLALLLVIKFMHGVKLVSIEVVHGILNWPYTGKDRSTKAIDNARINR